MNNKFKYTFLIIIFMFLFSIGGKGEYRTDMISKIIITPQDIPAGFAYGKIPSSFTKVFKDNPGRLENASIQKIAKHLYPGGDFRTIESIHASIIASERTPYGDDIVCYFILYKNEKSAGKEMKKLNEFAQYNSDRVIVITKENLAVYLLVDKIDNFHYIRQMADTIEQRMDETESQGKCAVIQKQ